MNTCIDTLTRQSVQKTAYNSKHQIKTLLMVSMLMLRVVTITTNMSCALALSFKKNLLITMLRMLRVKL